MKLTCPKCSSENLASPAEGIFRCADCSSYFGASFAELSGLDAPSLPKADNQIHAHPTEGAPARSGGGAGMIIWPLVLLLLLVVTFLGIIPMLFGLIFIVMAILGAVISQLARNK